MFYCIVFVAVSIVFRIVFNFKVQGREYLFRNVLTLSCSECKTDDIACITENDIGKVIEDKFFYLSRIHSNHLNASFP